MADTFYCGGKTGGANYEPGGLRIPALDIGEVGS